MLQLLSRVSDFTYVATWQGFVYVAFVIDVFARRIVGWHVSRTATAGFVLDAPEQAIQQRRPGSGLTHHSDRGSQYLSIRYTERLIPSPDIASRCTAGQWKLRSNRRSAAWGTVTTVTVVLRPDGLTHATTGPVSLPRRVDRQLATAAAET